MDPAVTKRAQPRCAASAANRCLELQGCRNCQLGGIVGRAGMDASEDVGALRIFGRIGVDRTNPIAPNDDRADAERRADPLVQVDADEVRFEIGQAEIELPDAVRGVVEPPARTLLG